ncbi:MAG: PAS domain S-box protein [Deltaproteobacteria bacterium]|nr:PAS domain S-box protein [Deltaproteobacteria bacterium]
MASWGMHGIGRPDLGQLEVLARLFESSPDMMCIAGVDGYFKRVNPAFRRLGYSSEELLSKPFLELVHPDDVDATLREIEKLRSGAMTMRFENRYRCKDATYCWLSWTAAPDGSGLLYAVARDVSLEKAGAEALRHAEERAREASRFLDAIIENLPNMIFVKEARTLSFERMNRAGEALLGLSRSSMLGRTDYDFFPEAEASFFQQKDRETLRGKDLVDIPEEPIQTPLGVRWLHTKKVPILDDDGAPTHLLGISEDITELKRATEASSRLAAIVESTEDAVISRSLDSDIQSWNAGAERVFGYSEAEVLGRPCRFLLPEDRVGEEREVLLRVVRGERVASFETVRRHKSGRLIDVSVTVSPVRDRAGTVVAVSSIARDITELKRMQREVLRAKEGTEVLNRELESFSYSVAHDLRAPLAAIDGFALAIGETPGLDSSAREHLARLTEASRLMSERIDALLRLSRVTQSELHVESVDLAQLARGVFENLRRLHPSRRVELVAPSALPVRGDPRLVIVLIENLIENAWKFTRPKDPARIELGSIQGESEEIYFVRDDGVGFDSGLAARLFQTFQRLHSTSEFAGHGVGLATVQRIVRRHRGRVWAESAGSGATFYFTLPVRDSAAPPPI